mgnify:CR=1 FL=1
MMTGDLPPSSSVTGVRLAAALFITSRPTGVEPVNSRWSNGREVKRCATSTPPFTIVISAGSNASAIMRSNSPPMRGVYSDILTITRLPAASAGMLGPTASERG